MIREDIAMANYKMWSKSMHMCVLAPLLGCAVAMAQAPGTSGSGSSRPASPSAGTSSSDTGSMNTGSNDQSFGEQAFMRKTLEGSDAEVQMGQLAQQKANSADVKQLGEKLAADHTLMDDKLFKPVAQSIGVDAPKNPSKKDKELMARLEALNGPQFDEEYIRTVDKEQRKNLKDFKTEAGAAQNPNVKLAAEKGAQITSAHLQMIAQVAQNHNIAVEEKPGDASNAPPK